MPFDGWLSTNDIAQIFRSEIAARKGQVWDAHDNGSELYLRATLPAFDEIKPGDWVQGGVALRGTADEISVHPYTLRKICTNGTISAHGTHSGRLARAYGTRFGKAGLTAALRGTIGDCCTVTAFLETAAQMKSALLLEVDEKMYMEPDLMHVSAPARQRLAGELVIKFLGLKDRSLFALINVVTAVARDEPDPALRWGLEVLGGALASGRIGIPRRARDRNAIARMRKAA